MNLQHYLKSFFLREFVEAHWLTLKYFFRVMTTINYPYEKKLKSSHFRFGALG